MVNPELIYNSLQPERHQNFEERVLLDSNRFTIALESLVNRKRCFLERDEWKTVPWALDPISKSSLHYLHDIMCDIPGLTEDADKLQQLELLERSTKRQRLSDDIISHLMQLYAWRLDIEQSDSHNWIVSPSLDVNSPFPMSVHYSSLAIAHGIVSYNAILLLLLKIGFETIGPSFKPYTTPQSASNQSLLHPPGTAPSAFAVATEICSSVEYHLECGDNAGAFFIIFPIRIAWQNFEIGSREKDWCESVMQRVAESGWDVGKSMMRNLNQD